VHCSYIININHWSLIATYVIDVINVLHFMTGARCRSYTPRSRSHSQHQPRGATASKAAEAEAGGFLLRVSNVLGFETQVVPMPGVRPPCAGTANFILRVLFALCSFLFVQWPARKPGDASHAMAGRVGGKTANAVNAGPRGRTPRIRHVDWPTSLQPASTMPLRSSSIIPGPCALLSSSGPIERTIPAMRPSWPKPRSACARRAEAHKTVNMNRTESGWQAGPITVQIKENQNCNS
jgi:hypothetical protein